MFSIRNLSRTKGAFLAHSEVKRGGKETAYRLTTIKNLIIGGGRSKEKA